MSAIVIKDSEIDNDLATLITAIFNESNIEHTAKDMARRELTYVSDGEETKDYREHIIKENYIRTKVE